MSNPYALSVLLCSMISSFLSWPLCLRLSLALSSNLTLMLTHCVTPLFLSLSLALSTPPNPPSLSLSPSLRGQKCPQTHFSLEPSLFPLFLSLSIFLSPLPLFSQCACMLYCQQSCVRRKGTREWQNKRKGQHQMFPSLHNYACSNYRLRVGSV